jgi:SAM-dependent methyltransferase
MTGTRLTGSHAHGQNGAYLNLVRTKSRRIAGSLCCALTIGAATAILVHAQTRAAKPGPGWTASDWIPWLEQPDRVAHLNIEVIVASLGLKPGDVVADIGAGAGAFEPALVAAVSPGGKVYANEIDPALLEHIAMRMREQHIGSIVTVLGKPADPNLPSRDVDVAFLHVVLHHVADRAAFIKSTAAYLKPSGRFAVIDLPRVSSDQDQQERFVSKDQVNRWMAAAGLRPLRELDFLMPGKWFMVYGKRDAG